MRAMLKRTLLLGLIIATQNCGMVDVFEKDLFEPGHAYYVESGQKTKDRKKYEAAYLVCYSIFYPKAQECLQLQNCGGNGYFVNGSLIPFCAETLADVPPGEFNYIDYGGL